jgi:hypothetical protein
MLAEIFMIRLEAVARAAKEAANSPRFVPVTLPAAKATPHRPPDRSSR